MLCNALVERTNQINNGGLSVRVSLITTSDRGSDAWALPDPNFDYKSHYYGRLSDTTLPELVRLGIKLGEHVIDQARLVGATAYDIYHIQWAPVATVDWLVLRLLRLTTPVVLTVHNVLPHESTTFDSISRKLLYHSVDHLIVHTDRSKERLIKQFDVSKNDISIIPHGNFSYMGRFDVDIDLLPQKVRELSERPTMLAFGLVREYKRLDIAIQALAIVQETVPDTALLVAGDSRTNMSKYYDLVAELGLESDVIFFTEYIPDELVPSVFTVADVCVFPYEDIDQSGAALLTATLGKPIVASDIAGFRDIVIPEETGILVDKNPEELAAAVSRILSDPVLRKHLGTAVAERAHSEFSWDAIADKTLELYHNLR
jgi:glycosyltransferase involved in cell wall biosynthesis